MRKVVIASVLKPVDDTRMFEKMGSSLARENDYEIFIIGQAVSNIPAKAGIRFLPTKVVYRVSIGRLLLPFKICLKLIKVKPDILIVNTHELLIVSLLNRIIFGCQIVYDIRENYYRNIKYSEGFPRWLRNPLARWVRFKEKTIAHLVHHFLLAEKVYLNELTYIGSRFTVLENKAATPTDFNREGRSSLNLLFTGTIAKSTGVFEAIALAESLHYLDQNVRLKIVGYCALEKTRLQIKKRVAEKSFIELIGFECLVPHYQIIEEIGMADFGIIYYPPLPHTLGSVPTKLYEYLAHKLPILTWDGQTFLDMVLSNKAGLLVREPYHELLYNLKSIKFYPQPIADVAWESEKFKLLIRRLLM